MSKHPWSRALAVVALALVLAGCKSAYPDEAARFRESFEAGRLAEAVEVAKESQSRPDETNLVWTLELANAQRLAGDIKGSIVTFEQAEEMLKSIDGMPDYSLSSEGLSTFSNPYQLTYRGRNLDRIFASTYHALACIESGSPERARVSMTRTLFRIDDAKRIARERSSIQSSEESQIKSEDTEFSTRLYSSDVAEARSAVQYRFRSAPAYADAMNPFAVWLHGIYFLHTAESPSDLEISRKSLQAAAAVAPSNKAITEDLALASNGNSRPDPGAGKTIVYVVHESGVAPYWSERMITLPLIYADPRAPIVNIALPEITPSAVRLRPVEVVTADATKVTTSSLANVDGIVHAEFKEEYPIARNRAIASSTMKAVAGYIANRAAEEHARRNQNNSGAQFAMLATLIVTNAYTLNSAQADLRSWTSLPKEVEMGRLVAPRGSQLRLSGGAIVGSYNCNLPAAKAVLVTIRSLAPGAPAVIRASILQK